VLNTTLAGESAGFNIVIGNPPYVFTRDADFSPELKDYVRQNYFSLVNTGNKGKANQSGKINLFALFIFKGILLINKEGVLSYITPNNLLRTTTYDNVRKFILEKCKLLELVDLGGGVFEKVTASTVITTVQKCEKEFVRDGNTVSVVTNIIDLERGIFSKNKIKQGSFLNNVSFSFNLFVNSKEKLVIDKIRNGKISLGSYSDDIIEGIVAHKHLITNLPAGSKYFPLLEGKCIKRYYITPAKKYLKWDKKEIHRTRPDYLWEAGQKILIQRISGGESPLTAALDSNMFKTFASINNLLLKPEYHKYYKAILALLNSRVLNWYYANSFSNNSELTVNISKTYLEQLPILELSEEVNNFLIPLVDKILYVKTNNQTVDTTQLEHQIDIAVYHLYNLTYEEAKIVDPELSKEEFEKGKIV
jgi:adenine-specific DNA-methyltransferase